MTKNKIVLVFSGPSGAGKSTLIKYVLNNPKYSAGLTVSHTTRPPRDGEKYGIDYYFISHKEFENMVKQNKFVEHVSCYGNRYGTSKSAINDVLNKHDICILDMEFEGAFNVLSNGNVFNFKSFGILIIPPSLKKLKSRLVSRNTETEKSLNKRLSDSFNVSKIANYHHVIINNELEESKRVLKNIVDSLLKE